MSVPSHRRLKVHGTREERRRIRAGLALMERYGWDRNLPSVCVIKALDCVSHTAGPFVPGDGSCLEINIEPADLVDDVETALAIDHEAYHAKRVREIGRGALTAEEELKAHELTKRDVEAAFAKEDRPTHLGRLTEELEQQTDYVEHYRKQVEGGT